jgi:Xaa-Pro aminopeptidase
MKKTVRFVRRFGILAVAVLVFAWAQPARAEISADEYAARRARVARELGEDALLVLVAPPRPRHMGGDPGPYRQEPNLYYLTGVDQPDSALVMVPGADAHAEVLFARDRDPRSELWDGRIPDHSELAAISGVSEVVSSRRLDSFLAAAFEGNWFEESDLYRYYRTPALPRFSQAVAEGRATVWLLLDQRPRRGEVLTPALALAADLRQRYPELRIANVAPIIEQLRQVKSEGEIARLRRAVEITGQGIAAAMQRAATATHEHQLEAIIEYTFRDRGACRSGYAPIVGAGANATVLHYSHGEDPIPRDGLVLLDVGAEYRRYTADITRTFPVSGRFSDPQREIYEVVLRAWEQGLEQIRAGSSLTAMHRRVEQVIAEGLVPLGLVSAATPEQTRLYFPHGAGHPIGLIVHDSFDRARALEPGMVVTLEPGIYVRPADVRASGVYQTRDDEARAGIDAALDRYADIGVRIEDDILVTATGREVLSDSIPRTVAEIEDAMRR